MSSPEKPKLKDMLGFVQGLGWGLCSACERGEHFCADVIDKARARALVNVGEETVVEKHSLQVQRVHGIGRAVMEIRLDVMVRVSFD